MPKEKRTGIGLLAKLLIGVFVPIVVAFLMIGGDGLLRFGFLAVADDEHQTDRIE